MVEESERERMLHAIYDAWQLLEEEAAFNVDHWAQPSRAILRGQLDAAQYPPFLRATAKGKIAGAVKADG